MGAGAVEIANLSAALCAVSVPAQGNPIVPRYKGPSTPTLREFANAAFFPFAPTPAPAGRSERLMAGIYRMNMITPMSFSGGMATPILTANTTDTQANDFHQSISPTAVGTDFGSAKGTNVIVTFFDDLPGSEGASTEDSDFSLWVFQFPIQQTQ